MIDLEIKSPRIIKLALEISTSAQDLTASEVSTPLVETIPRREKGECVKIFFIYHLIAYFKLCRRYFKGRVKCLFQPTLKVLGA